VDGRRRRRRLTSGSVALRPIPISTLTDITILSFTCQSELAIHRSTRESRLVGGGGRRGRGRPLSRQSATTRSGFTTHSKPISRNEPLREAAAGRSPGEKGNRCEGWGATRALRLIGSRRAVWGCLGVKRAMPSPRKSGGGRDAGGAAGISVSAVSFLPEITSNNPIFGQITQMLYTGAR
jgi:hypothetical protein